MREVDDGCLEAISRKALCANTRRLAEKACHEPSKENTVAAIIALLEVLVADKVGWCQVATKVFSADYNQNTAFANAREFVTDLLTELDNIV